MPLTLVFIGMDRALSATASAPGNSQSELAKAIMESAEPAKHRCTVIIKEV